MNTKTNPKSQHIKPGDAILIRNGHSSLWAIVESVRPDRVNVSIPTRDGFNLYDTIPTSDILQHQPNTQ